MTTVLVSLCAVGGLLLGLAYHSLPAKLAIPLALLPIVAWAVFLVPTGDDEAIGLSLLAGLSGFFVAEPLTILLRRVIRSRARRPAES